MLTAKQRYEIERLSRIENKFLIDAHLPDDYVVSLCDAINLLRQKITLSPEV